MKWNGKEIDYIHLEPPEYNNLKNDNPEYFNYNKKTSITKYNVTKISCGVNSNPTRPAQKRLRVVHLLWHK